MPRLIWAVMYAGLAGPAWAAGAAAAALPAVTAPTPLSSMLQMVLGLALVLALIVAMAWLFRRFAGGMMAGNGRVRVIGGTLIGQRERVVIVEVEGEWLVLGVTPHAVNLLTRQPRPDDAPSAAAAVPAEPFSRWLKTALDRASRRDDTPRS